ncbi:MAG: 50S ribosomal protein L30 [Chloroflexota bacterium]
MPNGESQEQKTIQITLWKSPIGYHKSQKATLKALGLHKLNQTVVRPDTPPIRGMVNKVSHLVRVDE